MALPELPPSWSAVLSADLTAPYFGELQAFLARERAAGTVYPPEEQVFSAFEHTPFERVRVFVLGQDPYPGSGQAHGLAFSVLPGVRPPPSLANIFKELHDDLGCRVPDNGYLVPWADQGVLLLHAGLTVRAGGPGSHQGKGWERSTAAAIQAVAAREEPAVFLLWGSYARKKAKLIDPGR